MHPTVWAPSKKKNVLSSRIFPIFSTGKIEPVLYRAWLSATSFVLSSRKLQNSSNEKNPLSSIERFLISTLFFNRNHG